MHIDDKDNRFNVNASFRVNAVRSHWICSTIPVNECDMEEGVYTYALKARSTIRGFSTGSASRDMNRISGMDIRTHLTATSPARTSGGGGNSTVVGRGGTGVVPACEREKDSICGGFRPDHCGDIGELGPALGK